MPNATAAAPTPFAMLLPVVMMFVVFYLLVFRPQTKARKDHELMVKHLKKNDVVVTSGGIFGTVVNIKPEAITLRIDENVRIDVEPLAITRLVKPRTDAQPAALAEKAR